MSVKQRFWLFMTVAWALVLLVLLVWMIWTGEYRLWAAWLAILCFAAVCLRNYAVEWRRLKDEREKQA